MLGSPSEAEDAIQESWLRLSRSGASGVEKLGGWLTAVGARVALDMPRARRSRREAPLNAPGSALPLADANDPDLEHAALLADSVGVARLVVPEALIPAARVAFVRHVMVAISVAEIAPLARPCAPGGDRSGDA